MDILDVKERRRDLCVEFMKLGMDFHTACVAAEVPQEEEDALAADESFVGEVNYNLAMKERDLLEKLNKVAEANAERGETKQLERILELMNPNRYSKVTKLSHQMDNAGGTPGKITVEFAEAEK